MRRTLTEIDKVLGDKIKKRRKEIGITQAELANFLDLSHQAVHKYESGVSKISLDRLIVISEFLDVNSQYFLEDFEKFTSQSTSYIQSISPSVLDFFNRIGKMPQADQVRIAKLFNSILDEFIISSS